MCNLIIALAHYCEKHGPKVIFLTQLQRNEGKNEEERNFYGNVSLLQQVQNSVKTTPEECVTCSSLGNSRVVVTNDHKAKVSFVSSPNGLDSKLLKRLNHVALRVCSCEVSHFNRREEGVGGSLILYDENLIQGTVISFVFTVKDSASRGHTRTYAIFALIDDSHWAQRISTRLLKDFRDISYKIQSDCYKTFQNDREEEGVRNLADLTNLSGLYQSLHARFTRILKDNFVYSFKEIIHCGNDESPPVLSNSSLRIEGYNVFKYLYSAKMSQQLCYLLLMGGTLNIMTDSKNKAELLTVLIESLIMLCPSTSKCIYLESNVAIIQGLSGHLVGNLLAHSLTEFQFTAPGCKLPYPIPRIIIRTLKILSNTNHQIAFKALREEIIGLTKLYKLQKPKIMKSVLKTQNFAETDELILSVWAEKLPN